MDFETMRQSVGQMVRFKDREGSSKFWSSGTLIDTSGRFGLVKISGRSNGPIKIRPEELKLWGKGNIVPIAEPKPAPAEPIYKPKPAAPPMPPQAAPPEPEPEVTSDSEPVAQIHETEEPAVATTEIETEPVEKKRNFLDFTSKVILYNWVKANAESCAKDPIPELIKHAQEELGFVITLRNMDSMLKQAGIERESKLPKETTPASFVARTEFLERTVSSLVDILLDLTQALGDTRHQSELQRMSQHCRARVNQH